VQVHAASPECFVPASEQSSRQQRASTSLWSPHELSNASAGRLVRCGRAEHWNCVRFGARNGAKRAESDARLLHVTLGTLDVGLQASVTTCRPHETFVVNQQHSASVKAKEDHLGCLRIVRFQIGQLSPALSLSLGISSCHYMPTPASERRTKH
jgi:hypothetical protein